MAVSNLSFAVLAQVGHSNELLALTMGFENFASGIGGVVVVAYLSALCNLSFTATQFALLSAAASLVGLFVTGTTAGGWITPRSEARRFGMEGVVRCSLGGAETNYKNKHTR